MAKKISNKEKRALIEQDLLDQLEVKGMTQAYYVSLVEDYMALWDMKNELVRNIQENGVTIAYDNGGGQTGTKKNDCVPELNRTNAQMLKLLGELGLRGADIKEPTTSYSL